MAQIIRFGGLAQLARAPALHAGGHRFDSDILHNGIKCLQISLLICGNCHKFIDILKK
jgi:hypothetical protein